MAQQELPGPVRWIDDRVGIAKVGRKNLRKVFPDHWSFMLGEIALYSFIILLLTGVFLTFWFRPSMAEVEYQGSYSLLKGLHMSEAYESTLRISFDIRGGLLMRQIHHWAAVLFVASMSVHLLRIFFTGAFRKPRELNWLIGIVMLFLGIAEGFIGYGLPDDLLSGTGLRITEGLVLASPVVGTYLSFFIFGGEFPGDDFVSRFYTVHVLLIPGLLLGLITAHLFLVVYHKHTQFAGPGRTEKNVVGYPLMPVYMAKAGGFFFVVFGVLAVMGALLQINPVWLYGPYNPAEVTAGSQPDWYMAWLDGAVRLMPGAESQFWGITLSWNIIVPALLMPPLFIGFVALYPFIEAFITGDKREHHLLDRPRNVPTRTGIGVGIVTFYGVLWLNSGNDLVATHFHLSINTITWVCRVLIFLGPLVAFWITRRIALSLQRADRERLLHGLESGVILRGPDGEYVEKHSPISLYEAYTLTAHERRMPYEVPAATDDNGIPAPGRRRDRTRAALSRFYFADTIQKPVAAELHKFRLASNSLGTGKQQTSRSTASHQELKMSNTTESVDVNVDVTTAYNQWTQFESFPHFMDGVDEIRQLDETHTHWKTSIGGVTREFDATITEQHPDERVAWKSTDGSSHAGVITFHRLSDNETRVTAQMDFEPEGVAETVADKAGLVSHRVKADMANFKEFIESRGSETGSWRGDVAAGS